MKVPKYFYFRVKVINKGTGMELEDASDVDVVEVIRCKDCKHQSKGSNECESWNLCGYRSWLYVPINDGDFCSRAERREE